MQQLGVQARLRCRTLLTDRTVCPLPQKVCCRRRTVGGFEPAASSSSSKEPTQGADGPAAAQAKSASDGPGTALGAWSVLGKWASAVLLWVTGVALMSVGVATVVAKVPQLWLYLGDWGTKAEWLALCGSVLVLAWAGARTVQGVQESHQRLIDANGQLAAQQQQLLQQLAGQQQQLLQQFAAHHQQLQQQLDKLLDVLVRNRLDGLEEGARQQ